MEENCCIRSLAKQYSKCHKEVKAIYSKTQMIQQLTMLKRIILGMEKELFLHRSLKGEDRTDEVKAR